MSKQKIFIATACKAPDIVRRSLLSWLLGVTVEYLRLPPALRDLSRTEGLGQMSFFRMAAIVGSAWLFLFGLSRFRNTAGAERWGMVVVFGILAVTSLASSFTWAFLTACVLILAVLGVFAAYGWDSRPALDSKPKKAPGRWLWITAGISVLFFLLVSGWTVGRVRSFSAPTFDFGIFSQMFYYMKGSGAPMTTVERDGLLSHFAVHVSPIYYLLLPIYAVAPRPETLQILRGGGAHLGGDSSLAAGKAPWPFRGAAWASLRRAASVPCLLRRYRL